MRIKINGQWEHRPAPLTLEQLLEALSLQGRRVAVELNEAIVRRADHARTELAENDRLEIVTLVGGG